MRGQVIQEAFHLYEDPRIVGGRRQDQVAVAENGSDDLACRRHGNIEHVGRDALFPQTDRKAFRRVFGMMIDRGIGDHDAGLFRRVGGPVLVAVHDIRDILSPHEAVKRTQILNLKTCRLLQDSGYLVPVLPHDIRVIPACLFQIIPVKVHLIRKERTVCGAEGSEGIGGEKNPVGGIVGHHDLRPVDHRSIYEGQCMRTAREGLSLLHDDTHRIHVKREILLHHDRKLLVAEDPDIRIAPHQLFERRAVVRFHVMHHDIVQMTAGKRIFDILKEHCSDRGIHRVEQNSLLIQKQVGIIGNPARNRIDALKHGKPSVICTHKDQVIRYLSAAIHCISSFLYSPSKAFFIFSRNDFFFFFGSSSASATLPRLFPVRESKCLSASFASSFRRVGVRIVRVT